MSRHSAVELHQPDQATNALDRSSIATMRQNSSSPNPSSIPPTPTPTHPFPEGRAYNTTRQGDRPRRVHRDGHPRTSLTVR